MPYEIMQCFCKIELSNVKHTALSGWRIQGVTFQEYFGRPLPADACLPELRREFAAEAELEPESDRSHWCLKRKACLQWS